MKEYHILDLYNIICVGAYAGRSKSYASQNIPTGGIYQVLQRIRKIQAIQNKDKHIIVVTDSRKNFRKDKYDVYKAQRGLYDSDSKKIQREAVRLQEIILKGLFRKMGIPVFEVDGYEADDLVFNILFNLATVGETPLYNSRVYLHTSDGDWIGNMTLSPENILFDCTTTTSDISKVKTFNDFELTTGKSPDYEFFERMIYGDKADNYKGVQTVFSGKELDKIYDKVTEILQTTPVEHISWNMDWWKEFMLDFAGTDENKIRVVLESVELAFPYYMKQIAEGDIIDKLNQTPDWKVLYQFTDLFQIKIFEKDLGAISKFSEEKAYKLNTFKEQYKHEFHKVFKTYEGLSLEVREPVISIESVDKIYDYLYNKIPKIDIS